MIRAIVALDKRQGIARQGGIPWRIPIDSQYFQLHTVHTTVVMGRVTYEEFTEPLPNRQNVVISRQLKTVRTGFLLVNDLEQYLTQTTEDVWIIGGSALYTAALSHCHQLYVTEIAADFSCDRFFPEYQDDFSLQTAEPWQQENGLRFRFTIFSRL